MSPLHVAAKKGESLDIVDYLIDKGANINIQNTHGVSENIYSIDSTDSSFINLVA